MFVSLVFVLFDDLELYFKGVLLYSTENKSTYALISFLVLSSDILLPVPSSIVMFMNGSVLGFTSSFFLSLTSSLFSSCIGYYLGRCTNLGYREQPKAISYIKKYGGMAIVFSRGIPILSESISITSGFNRISFKTYLILNTVGYIPVCFIYSLFGNLGSDENLFLLSFSVSILLSAIVWFFGKSLLNDKIINLSN